MLLSLYNGLLELLFASRAPCDVCMLHLAEKADFSMLISVACNQSMVFVEKII
jgi:hypothetical protein